MSCPLGTSHALPMRTLMFSFSGPTDLNTSLHSGTDSAGKVENAPAPNLGIVHRDTEVLLGNQQICYLMALQGK